MHLRGPAAACLIEGQYSPLRPAMAFREQGHGQEYRCGSRGQSDANRRIAVDAEAPLQGRANIIDVGGRDRSLLPLVLNSFEQPLVVLGMSSGKLLQFAALNELRERIDSR